MNKHIFHITTVALLTLFVACNSTSTSNSNKQKNNDFSSLQSVACEDVDNDITIESWLISNDMIVCKTAFTDSVYHTLDLSTMKHLASFGKIGHGHNEWIAPNIFAKTGNKLAVFDNANRTIYDITNYAISVDRKTSIKDAMNDIKTIMYPYVGYTTVTPNEICLKIVNIEKDILTDSISFKDTEGEGKASQYEFAWGYDNGRIVIAHLYKDAYMTCKVNDEGKITEKDYYLSNGKNEKQDMYYSDATCGDDIYLLSQKQVDTETLKGKSEIEVYDYNGKPIKKFLLDFIAEKILLDKKGRRLLLVSAENGHIRYFKL